MEKTIVRIEFGSHLYGTNTPTSDHDYKSVFIPSGEDILLQRVKGSKGHKVVRFEGDKNAPEDTDDEAYSLQRYLSLLSEGQTVAIDMLFAPNLIISSDIWSEIKQNKNLLLTKQSASFVGYCRTQANKYGIKGSRVAAAKEAMELLHTGYKNLGATAKIYEISDITRLIGEHTKIVDIENNSGKTERFLDCCNRKVSFKATCKLGYEIFSNIYENYGKRARLAEANEGIDWKALSHAVRVGNEAIELLTTGNVTFPLANRQHILSIKLGQLPYDQVANEIEELLLSVEQAAESSSLRDYADRSFIDSLVYRTYKEAVLDADKSD